jgi:alpha-mannosidase
MFYTVEKIEKQIGEIKQTIYREIADIPLLKYFEGDCANACERYFDDSDWQDFKVGNYWGGYDITVWFRAKIPIPNEWMGRKLALRFIVGPRDGGDSTAETLLYINGLAVQGIDVWHEEACLPLEFLKESELTIALKAWSGVLGVPNRRCFKLAQLVLIDEGSENLYYTSDTLVKTVKVLNEYDLRRTRLVQLLNEAFHRIDFLKPRSQDYYRSLKEAAGILDDKLKELRAIEEIKPKVVGIGHSHIDMAWLWRLNHTREKASRTFSTVLNLMSQYPEYRFMHSSPQLYKFLKQDYPEIYARVREKIISGEWEITGGMWVEPDTNLPGGESLIRQILFGKRFIKYEFNMETNLVWLPDVFGYTGSLPQLIKKSGMKYFMTTKISWNQFNRFPYDTFHWRGIDGTEVLTHFITTPENGSQSYTYNGTMQPEEIKGIWENYNQKDINEELLISFGWGDGGGGPTKEMIEAARVMENIPGLPRVELGKTEPYFERLEKRLEGKDVPIWDGELYFELHRGTYTSQAYIKRANRKVEIIYNNAEWLASVTDTLCRRNEYPQKELNRGWEMILLNQFHDVLPGSSIHEVYEDCKNDYEIIASIGEKTVNNSMVCITEQIDADEDGIVVFNPLSWQRNDFVEFSYSKLLDMNIALIDDEGRKLLCQTVVEDGNMKTLVEVSELPSLGYRYFEVRKNVTLYGSQNSRIIIRTDFLENPYYRISLDKNGQMISIYDKKNSREVLSKGEKGNVFQTFEDKPLRFDAWDIDIYYKEKMREIDELISAEVIEEGPIRGVLKLQWRFYDSVITQRITLYNSCPRIDFKTEINWQEKQTLLKVAFPVNIRSAKATYEIQFGNIERATHWNTSWDYAKFEVVGHKWADLSEGNYGVGLLNDCKYGYDIKDNVMRLTLIKSAIKPDAGADKCHHVFTYSLLPHAGSWRESRIVEEAYSLNYPLLTAEKTAQKGRLPKKYRFAAADSDSVIIETVKKAEDADAWIIRVYEYRQDRLDKVTITFGKSIEKAVECNLMEEEDKPVSFEGKSTFFSIAPYEIKTFKVWF